MPKKQVSWLLRQPGRWYRRLLPRRLRRMLLVPLGIVAVGTVSYPLIEGPPWTFFDGLYMTVITLTTLGYGEIPEPLSKPGRVFTMVLALGGIFVLFYIATDMIRSIVTGELRELLGQEHMDDQLKHLSGHLIVCGFGRMGRIVCDELERYHQRFVVIDTLTYHTDWKYSYGLRIQGNATDDAVLKRAGIERANALIAVVGSDAENLYICLSARLLNPKLNLVARAEEEAAEAKLKRIGVNKVISPYLTGGHRAVQAVLKPTVLHFVEMTTRAAFDDLQVEELHVEIGSALAGKSLKEAKLSTQYGVTIVGVVQPNGKAMNAPTGETVIDAGTILVAVGKRANLEELERLVSASK